VAKAASNEIISLPKGGGAMHGIGEKFSPDLHTGTGNFTVPIALPPGRNGFQPQLNLVYSTGSGNGPFGLGWSLSIPGVSRKTSKGIPVYNDAKDVFILSGAEDLVPVEHSKEGVIRYRPRTDGLFARILHHCHPNNDYWEVQSKDGLISCYGTERPPDAGQDWRDPATIADPENPDHIFAWKLTRTADPFGNRIEYRYDRDRIQIDGPHHWDQLYLREIAYVDHGDRDSPKFLVKVRFVYEDRPDPFSEYRAGFEIRTIQRCTRIEIYTNADQERLIRTYRLIYLDQREEFQNRLPLNGVSLLSEIRVIGREGEHTEKLPPLEFNYTAFEPEHRKYAPFMGQLPASSLGNPNLELVDLFGNGLPDILEMSGTVRYWRNLGGGKFDAPRMMQEAPAESLAEAGVQLIDANGDGRSDLLVTRDGRAGYYPLTFGGRWDPKSYQPYKKAPSFNLEDPEVRLVDLDGDGITDALRSGTRFECFFNDPYKGWDDKDPKRAPRVERKALEDFPNVNFSDPRVKWADMTGDGLQDIVLIHNGRVDYWPNLGYGRWGKRITMKKSPHFEDAAIYGPIGYDPKRILLGDIDGDGVADLVYIASGHITVWINQSGNGWSEPIPIRGTPPITDLDAVRLADIYGTGTAGILWTYDYGVHRDSTYKFLDLTGGIKPYLLNKMDNHIGAVTKVEYASSTHFYLSDQKDPKNRWKTPLPFPVQVVSRVRVDDELSKGRLTTEYRYHHGYWDGAEREFRGFGMVEQYDTESFDTFEHEGPHDDKTTFERFLQAASRDQFFSKPTLTKTWFHQGPVGPEYGDWEELNRSSEYWQGDPELLDHTQKVNEFLANYNTGPNRQRSPNERRIKRDALRSLRGSILRTELYALDGFQFDGVRLEGRPYTVTEYAYGLREEPNPLITETDSVIPRIFFPHRIAERTTQWERGDDPMTSFSFTGDYDDFGQPLHQTTVAMPRRIEHRRALPRNGIADEIQILATHSRTAYAKPDDPSTYIFDRVAYATSFELTSPPELGKSDPDALYDQKSAAQRIHDQFEKDLKDWKPEQSPPPSYRVFSHTVNRYEDDENHQPYLGLPAGQIGKHGALTLSESLVLTDAAIKAAYANEPLITPEGKLVLPPSSPVDLSDDMGYQDRTGNAGYVPGFYIKTKQQKFDTQVPADPNDQNPPKPRGLIVAQRDPLDHETTIDYDPYQLLPTQVTAPVTSLKTQAVNDYRVLQPCKIIDPNGNVSSVRFSPLGLPLETWVKGDQARPSFRLEYDFLAFMNSPPNKRRPVFVRTVRHCHHDTETDVTEDERDKIIETREFSDGFGRLLQTRSQAEDAVFAMERNVTNGPGADLTFGDSVLPQEQSDRGGAVVGYLANGQPRVIVSGWQRYDNKGRVVEKYEPFFDVGWDYDPHDDAQLGRKATLFYDPRGQVIRTLNPDGSEQRVIYGKPAKPDDLALDAHGDPFATGKFLPSPWEIYTYDANDLAPISYRPETAADEKRISLTDKAPSHHHFTPSSALVDALGRTLLAVERNRAKAEATGTLPAIQEYYTRSQYDIQGNLLKVTDALGRAAFRHTYDLAKRMLRIDSLDAGTRRIALDAAGNEIQRRDSKGSITLRTYDILNRPKQLWAINHNLQNADITLREDIVYGDDLATGFSEDETKNRNLLGKPYRHRDEAGQLTFEQYDFKGNLLENTRQVIADDALLTALDTTTGPAKIFVVDWRNAPALEGEYRTSTTYDALNRIKTVTYPQDVDGQRKILRPRYNRAGALESVALGSDIYVDQIAYNAKGQRTLIAYGNGVMTRYAYDPDTFRLKRLRTERYTKSSDPNNPEFIRYQANGGPLQDFMYDYDLVGNITGISERVPGCGVHDSVLGDDALNREFEYDSLYRLIRANGRQATNIGKPRPWEDLAREAFGSWKQGTANQDNAPNLTSHYWEEYVYDPAGNLLALKHSGDWTRRFGMAGFTPEEWQNKVDAFIKGDDVDFGDAGNRLTHLSTNALDQPQTHFFDPNGNLIREFTNRHFAWDHTDRLVGFANRPNPNADATVEAIYLYDSGGQRVKKLVRKGANDYEVSVYIDGVFEHHLRLKKNNGTVQVEQENNTLHVMDNQSRIALVRVGDAFPGDGAEDKPVQYHLGDHLGSSQLVIGGATAATANEFMNLEEYFPYGETSFGSFARKRFRFTGKERDEESGLYYHGARYYAPWLVRWVSCDPAGKIDGLNLFHFVKCNPIKFLDKSGMALETAWDVANVAMGIRSIASWDENTSLMSKVADVSGLVVDTAAVILPFVPGGAGAAIKGIRMASKAGEVVQTVASKIETATAIAKDVKSGNIGVNTAMATATMVNKGHGKQTGEAVMKKSAVDNVDKAKKAKLDRRIADEVEQQGLETRDRWGKKERWKQERERVKNWEPTDRDWGPQQRQDIEAGRTPEYEGEKIELHHKQKAEDYPELRGEPGVFEPRTRREHIFREHGGDTAAPTQGVPKNPDVPEDF
jgi:RHS repeat-associated protein